MHYLPRQLQQALNEALQSGETSRQQLSEQADELKLKAFLTKQHESLRFLEKKQAHADEVQRRALLAKEPGSFLKQAGS